MFVDRRTSETEADAAADSRVMEAIEGNLEALGLLDRIQVGADVLDQGVASTIC